MKWIPSFVLELMRPRLSRAFRAAAWHPDTDPALMDYEEAATRGNSLLMMKSLILQSAQPDPAGFAALTLPVEVIAGDADRLTPVASAEALVQALPNATLHVIDRAGHQMMLEQPADTNRLIFEVIGRAAPG
jgi:abhydrolase domain-containing protein 8